MGGRQAALFLFTATLLLTSAGCSRGNSQTSDASAAAMPAAQAAAAPAQPPAEEEFTATGPIIVENQVDVLALRDGVLAQLMAETGQRVRKGQILARLDDRQLVAERDAAAARLRSIEADVKNWEAERMVRDTDLRRIQEMRKADLVPEQTLEHARYKLIAVDYEVERERQVRLQAVSTLRALELELEKTRIAAPFDGVVARRYVRAGQQVTKDSRLYWVSATSPMRVVVSMPERYVGALRRGDIVTVKTPGSDAAHQARILVVSPVVDPSSATIEVTAELVKPAPDVVPGMSATVFFPRR